jgi:hypothetical protein
VVDVGVNWVCPCNYQDTPIYQNLARSCFQTLIVEFNNYRQVYVEVIMGLPWQTCQSGNIPSCVVPHQELPDPGLGTLGFSLPILTDTIQFNNKKRQVKVV